MGDGVTQVQSPRATQSDRRAEAESRLLEAAAALISEGGTAGVTLAAIGERAGYSRGLASHHFGSKPAMMQRLVETVHHEFSDQVASGEYDGTALGELFRLIRTFTRLLVEPPPLHRAFLILWADSMAGSPELRPEMSTSDRGFRRGIEEIIRRGISSREFLKSVDVGGIATTVVGTLRGVALQTILDAEDFDLDASRREFEAMLELRLRLRQP